jgi:hypothetical protein
VTPTYVVNVSQELELPSTYTRQFLNTIFSNLLKTLLRHVSDLQFFTFILLHNRNDLNTALVRIDPFLFISHGLN